MTLGTAGEPSKPVPMYTWDRELTGMAPGKAVTATLVHRRDMHGCMVAVHLAVTSL